MRAFCLLLTLVLIPAGLAAQSPDSLRAVALLQQLDREHQAIRDLAYHMQYTWYYPSVKDSVQIIEGNAWLLPEKRDTIFGYVFHLSGKAAFGGFDSYYDRQQYIEANHRDSTLLVVNPYLFPNDFSNPAKNRSALNLIQPMLFRADLSDYLLHNYPYGKTPALSLQQSGGLQQLILAYPPNAYNATTTITLTLTQPPLRIVKAQSMVQFNGTLQTQTWEISKRRENQEGNVAGLTPQQAYAGYKQNEVKPKKQSHYVYPLLGKPAPGFRYMGFDGKAISLASLKGRFVLLDFWETWCGYCIMAFPKIKSLYEKYHSRGFEIVGITTENPVQVEELIRLNQLPYLHVKADTAMLRDYVVSGRPHYVLIGPDGNVLSGPGIDSIEKLLEEKLPRQGVTAR
ncbi:TlpA disulfide reductase family protein [Chitinophaga sp. YIM B06452]|uniref:TlpA family protein disulfide reductase n=1 Tax=Chitinophaga sp. YIM B06452 TaxID=3082158 RepID=UPI0031FE7DAA